jgi:putative FmdB family regulatory protein
MPLYEYKCPKGHVSEDVQSFKDSDKPITCKTCGAKAERIISLTGQPKFVAGCGGFYKPTT